MSNRRKTSIEIGREFNISIPGPVPTQPPFNEHIQCDCEHCKAYLGTYQLNPDDEELSTHELVQ